jgi:hypothetical protein
MAKLTILNKRLRDRQRQSALCDRLLDELACAMPKADQGSGFTMERIDFPLPRPWRAIAVVRNSPGADLLVLARWRASRAQYMWPCSHLESAAGEVSASSQTLALQSVPQQSRHLVGNRSRAQNDRSESHNRSHTHLAKAAPKSPQEIHDVLQTSALSSIV